MAKTTESELYDPVRRLLEAKGFLTQREFAVLPPDSATGRLIDLVGFRFEDDGDLAAVAVEVKDGDSPRDVLAGLPQGIEYQLVFPRVFLASRTSRYLLGHAQGALKDLGLGYIAASSVRAATVHDPASSARLHRKTFTVTVRHAGLLLLLWEDIVVPVLGDDAPRVHSLAARGQPSASARKREGRDEKWVFGIHEVRDVQFMLHVGTGRQSVLASVWVEAQPSLRRIWTRLQAADVADLVAESGATWTARLARRSYGRLKWQGERKVLNPRASGFQRDFNRLAKKGREKGVNVVISIDVELWPRGARPKRARAERAIAGALKRLLPVQEWLEDLRTQRTRSS